MDTLRRHYPEYLMEAAGLGIFMISASVVTLLLEHPASPIRQAIIDPLLRRFMIGVAMGLSAIAIVYSPWGKQSGAHLNPAFTFTFFRLGKIKPWDALSLTNERNAPIVFPFFELRFIASISQLDRR